MSGTSHRPALLLRNGWKVFLLGADHMTGWNGPAQFLHTKYACVETQRVAEPVHRLRNKLRRYNLKIDALVNVGYRLVMK